MTIEKIIHSAVSGILQKIYRFDAPESAIQIQNTRKDFEGDITLVVFPFLRYSKKPPEETAREIGDHLKSEVAFVESFNVIKGFLNLVISRKYWVEVLMEACRDENYGIQTAGEHSPLMMVEYSSPNTNKPLHLGHIRNNLLGYAVSEIQKANGYRVVKTNIVNDRGIHICKSMVAWKKWGGGKTPRSAGMKGDHFVGSLYVEFNKHYQEEIDTLTGQGYSREEAEKRAPSILEAREMLRRWEARDPETVELWKTMNNWVYEGFDATYRRLGVDFDKIYYESDTYLEGKKEVLRGVKEGIFVQEADQSVWADLTGENLDRKILLRSDGTSVYMTQDIGTAKMRFDDYSIDKMVYVVGNEQIYHFQVLAVLLDKLGFEWGKDLFHFSYGMVELPSGKMKSREGTVVDADDLMEEMVEVAARMAEELGKLDSLTPGEKQRTIEVIALGALKYFILKVDPKKNMLFNPEESIDFNGNTGPFIQYTFARIQSVLRKASENNIPFPSETDSLQEISEKEKLILKRIALFPEVVREAGAAYSPALIANFCYELAREYNQFYHDHSVLSAGDTGKRDFRMLLSFAAGKVIQRGMGLLGIELPGRM